MARRNKKTVRIRSHDKTSIDQASSFGIYAIPDFDDRIFCGPYNNNVDHGLETFRYVNGELVNTRIYNQMRGNAERKTTGKWYIHSRTLNNTLNLEPEFEPDNFSSTECSTEVVYAEKAVKPQIEFVDLTGNDSEDENDIEISAEKIQSSIDPLFNVLTTDFSKQFSNDITIERISEDGKTTTISDDKKSELITKQHSSTPFVFTKKIDINELLAPKEKLIKRSVKRKLIIDPLNDSTKKKQMEIEIINLDDEMPNITEIDNTIPFMREVSNDKMPELSPSDQEDKEKADKRKKMPQLYPITTYRSPGCAEPKTKDSDAGIPSDPLKLTSILKPVSNIIYVISNIPGFGYIDISIIDDKYHVPAVFHNISKGKKKFKDIMLAIVWLEKTLFENIFYLPVALDLGLYSNKEAPDMPKFNDKFMNGFHMVCSKGVYDLLTLSTADIDNLGFNESETTEILAYKCKALIKKNIKVLATNIFVDENDDHNIGDSKILAIAPQKIKKLEVTEASLKEMKKKLLSSQKEAVSKINSLLKEVSKPVENEVRKNVRNILCKKFSSVKIIEDELKTATITKSSTIIPSPPMQPASTQLVNQPLRTILPAGKVFKIVDGKMVMLESLSSPSKKLKKKIIKQVIRKRNLTNVLVTPPSINPLPVEHIRTVPTMKFKLVNGSYLLPLTTPQVLTIPVAGCSNRRSKTLLKNKQSPSAIVDLTDS